MGWFLVEISDGRVVNMNQIVAIHPPGWDEYSKDSYRIHFSSGIVERATKDDVNKIMSIWTR